jgi:septum formation protein
MFEDKQIILASSSPRRRELLQRAEIAFKVRAAAVKEDYPQDLAATAVPEYLAGRKALAVQKVSGPDELILAADTIVLAGETVIGKPANGQQARDILQMLSGKAHEVITGVCLLKASRMRKFSERTRVYFYPLDEDQIDHYIETYRPMDKAGAYAIQEWIGLTGIRRIEGDYFNVVGLPVGRVIREIAAF